MTTGPLPQRSRRQPDDSPARLYRTQRTPSPERASKLLPHPDRRICRCFLPAHISACRTNGAGTYWTPYLGNSPEAVLYLAVLELWPEFMRQADLCTEWRTPSRLGGGHPRHQPEQSSRRVCRTREAPDHHAAPRRTVGSGFRMAAAASRTSPLTALVHYGQDSTRCSTLPATTSVTQAGRAQPPPADGTGP
jgi:hypothetical protein